MRRRPRYRLFMLLLLASTTALADIVGKVVAVTDGDTIRVLDAAQRQYKVRLAGIDAPEKGQPFGNASRKYLASLVAGKTVRVEFSKTDRYGRVLGKVWVRPPACADCEKTLDANLAQIVAGMAWWYQYYASDQPPADRELYKSAVNDAKAQGAGLWSERDAIPPWAWRRGRRTPDTGAPAAAFQCGSKRYCRQMTSCDEARFYLRECGLQRLDGDRDGVPCEAICR